MKKIFTLALGLGILSSLFAQSPYSKQQGYPGDSRNDGYSSPNKGGVYTDNRNDVYRNSSPLNKGDVYNRNYDGRDQRFEHRYNEQYSFSTRERDARIFQINREYESRLNAIKYNRFMRNSEKRWELRRLEDQRAQEIRMVLARFEDNRNKYNDRYYDRNYNWRN